MKLKTQIKIFDCELNVDFEAELQEDGSMILEFYDAIYIPAGKFKIVTLGDMR